MPRSRRSRLKRWLLLAAWVVGGMTVFGVIVGVTLWNWPTGFYEVSAWLGRRAVGASLVVFDVNGDLTPALDGGPTRNDDDLGTGKTPVLLLHGWGTSKEAMMAQMAWLSRDRRVVIPDLPGFGDNPYPSDAKPMNGAQYVEWLEAFRQAAGLGKVDVIGESMGGALAAAYAAAYPDSVRRIVLESAAGMRAPVTNAFMRDVESGKNPLRMASEEDFDRVIDLVFASPPPVPTPFRKYLVQRAVANLPKTEEMIDALRPFLVAGNEGQLEKINAPTLILYGSADRVTDPSLLEVYRSGIRESEAILIQGAGHVVFNDAPRETYRAVMGFLNR